MRITLTLTAHQYKVLGKKHSKEGIGGFILSSLYAKFGNCTPCLCAGEKTTEIRKQAKVSKEYNFRKLPEEIQNAIICESAQMGITPATYIIRFILAKDLVD